MPFNSRIYNVHCSVHVHVIKPLISRILSISEALIVHGTVILIFCTWLCRFITLIFINSTEWLWCGVQYMVCKTKPVLIFFFPVLGNEQKNAPGACGTVVTDSISAHGSSCCRCGVIKYITVQCRWPIWIKKGLCFSTKSKVTIDTCT